MTHDVEFEHHLKAEAALRDILYMYRELANWRGLYDDFGSEDGTFEPLDFVDCSSSSVGLEALDLRLLHEGSAIKLLCHMLQAWSQGGFPANSTEYIRRIRAALDAGRFKHLSELEILLKLSFESDEKVSEKSDEVYQKYIVSYFHRLLGMTDYNRPNRRI